MANAWDVFLCEWLNGVTATGWASWLGHVLMPLIVLILLSNVSAVRVLLELRHGSPADARIPRFSSLLAPPIFLSGASLLASLFAARRPWARPIAETVHALAALSWAVTVIRLSAVIARLTAQHAPSPAREDKPPRERAPVAAISANHMPPHPTVSGSSALNSV